MLQNACLLAKIGADTAENERNFAENLPKICNYPTGPSSRDSSSRELEPKWLRVSRLVRKEDAKKMKTELNRFTKM